MECVSRSDKIPFGMIEVECRSCGKKYLVSRKELRRTANAHRGWFPCHKCGSTNTTWNLD